jgi:hypothetical protein
MTFFSVASPRWNDSTTIVVNPVVQISGQDVVGYKDSTLGFDHSSHTRHSFGLDGDRKESSLVGFSAKGLKKLLSDLTKAPGVAMIDFAIVTPMYHVKNRTIRSSVGNRANKTLWRRDPLIKTPKTTSRRCGSLRAPRPHLLVLPHPV